MSQGFTKAQRAKAVELAHLEGVAHAAEATGCSRQSIYNWIKDSIDTEKTPEEIQREALYQSTLRASIRIRLLEKIDNLLDRFDQPHYDYRGKDADRVTWDSATSGDIRSYATAIGILLDKYRLEMGEATSRSRLEGTDDIDRSVQNLVAEMARRSEAETS